MEKNEIFASFEYIRAEKAALRLVARAEQCSAGLTRKLEKRKFDSSSIGAVISKLTEMKLIDDNRFARLWLQSRVRFARSPRRLLSSLCARGIDREEAQNAVNSMLNEEGTELAILARFVKKNSKKLGGKKRRVCKNENNGSESEYDNENKNESEKRSLKFLLKSEGFSSSAIETFLSHPRDHL